MKLATAVMSGNAMLVRRLLENGANPDKAWSWVLGPGGEWWVSALGIAAAYGHRRIAIALIEANACVTRWQRPKRNVESWLNPLDAAICFEHIDLARLLVQRGADPNYRYCDADPDADGLMAMHLAARQASTAYVSMLLQAKACVNANARGTTPLLHAIRYDNVQVVGKLLQAGARIESGMLTAAAGNANVAIARRLLKASADVNERRYGMTPLHAAVDSDQTTFDGFRRRENCVELLLESGACTNVTTDEHGDTPLHIAASIGSCNLIVMLSSYGAKPNVLNRYGNTPADDAQEEGLDFVKDVLIMMRDWVTPLHHLTCYMKESRIQALLEARADLHARASPASPSPLDIARLTCLSGRFVERQDASRILLNYWCAQKRALAMATHNRLGADSPARRLCREEFEIIVAFMAA